MTLEEFTTDVFTKVCDALGVNPSLEIVHETSVDWSACFWHDDYKVSVNTRDVRTARDIVVLVAHEVRHAWQYKNLPQFDKFTSNAIMYRIFGDTVGYNLTPSEMDANIWALSFEDNLKYKNKVYNRNNRSHFVELKMLYNNVDEYRLDLAKKASQEKLNEATTVF